MPNEVLNTMFDNAVEDVDPFPFLQEDIYHAEQTGKHSIVHSPQVSGPPPPDVKNSVLICHVFAIFNYKSEHNFKQLEFL